MIRRAKESLRECYSASHQRHLFQVQDLLQHLLQEGLQQLQHLTWEEGEDAEKAAGAPEALRNRKRAGEEREHSSMCFCRLG